MRDYDLCVLGGTGFTGKHVLKYLSLYLPDLRVCVTGRSKEQVQIVISSCEGDNIFKEYKAKDPITSQFTPYALDINDKDAMKKILGNCTAVLNCTGPYRLLGRPIVEAAVDSGTHYFDISGEPEFMESIQLDFHDKALEAGVLVVSACAFDSVPADLGTLLMSRRYPILSSIETFLRVSGGPQGAVGHSTTFECAVLGMKNAHILSQIRKARSPTKPRKAAGVFVRRNNFFTDDRFPEDVTFYPFPGADASVIKRSQEHFADSSSDYVAPNIACYFGFEGRLTKFKLICGSLLMKGMNMFNAGTNLLINYPEFFTFGYFSKSGPNKNQLLETKFRMDIFGNEKEHKLTITGAEPGYIATPCLAVNFVKCALKNIERLEKGVYTPGYILSKCGSNDELIEHFNVDNILNIEFSN